jgi:hypothetical protein
MIRKLKSGEYRLYSKKKDKSGKRKNLGTFKSRAAAREARAGSSILQESRLISRSGQPISPLDSNQRRWTALILAATIGCSEATRITAPVTRATFAGFDTSIYPGDAALQAWMKPGSPYEWVGYYLEAPCHRDTSWGGKRATLSAMGWGFAVIYVGQQTFDGVAAIDPTGPLNATPTPGPAHAIIIEDKGVAATCSRTLLSREQGLAEADDAIAKTAAQGFPTGSVIYLDLERMETITPAMEAYYSAWIERVLSDGRFFPGIYCHNVQCCIDSREGDADSWRRRSVSQDSFLDCEQRWLRNRQAPNRRWIRVRLRLARDTRHKPDLERRNDSY